MRLAISNIGWDAVNNSQVYQYMKQYGFEGLEIAPTKFFPEQPYSNLSLVTQLRKSLEKEGFVVPSLQSIWYGRTENMFRNEEERQILYDYTKQAICFAEALGAHNLVFGCPKNRNNMQSVGTADIEKSFFYELGDYAYEHHTVIGMEPNPTIYQTNYMNTTEETVRLIRRIDSNGFRLNVDFGTIIQNQETLDVLEENADVINHVHISEPGLRPIQSNKNHVRLAEILKKSGYQGFVSIEMGMQENITIIDKTMRYVKEIFGD